MPNDHTRESRGPVLIEADTVEQALRCLTDVAETMGAGIADGCVDSVVVCWEQPAGVDPAPDPAPVLSAHDDDQPCLVFTVDRVGTGPELARVLNDCALAAAGRAGSTARVSVVIGCLSAGAVALAGSS